MAFGGGIGGPSGAGTTTARGCGVDYQIAWGKLHDVLKARVSGDLSSDVSGMASYTDVYHICVSGGPPPLGMGLGQGKRLYHNVKEFLVGHCAQVVVRLVQLSSSPDCSAFQFLEEYASLFHAYVRGMEEGSQLLRYLDKIYVTKHHHKLGSQKEEGVMYTWELAPLMWRQTVLDARISELNRQAVTRVAADLRAEVLVGGAETTIEQARALGVLRAVVESYVLLGKTLEPQNAIGFYKEQLEDYVLQDVFKHYAERAKPLVSHAQTGTVDEGLVAEYIRAVDRCLASEQAIWSQVHPSTARGAVRVVRKSMLEETPHHEILMAFARVALAFRQERLDDLHLLYALLDNEDIDPVRGIDALRQVFFTFVKDVGAREVKRVNEEARTRLSSPARPNVALSLTRAALPADYVSSEAIQTMLDLYSHYLNIVHGTFEDNQRFSKAFKTACEYFINHLPNMAESLAIHTHYFLDRTCPESQTEQMDAALDSIMLLFNFIQDKDMFHRTYAQLLATRIITCNSVSDDAEQRMMRHLRQVCGFQYAMTFQRMFMDKALSTEMSEQFGQWLQEREAARAGSMMDVVPSQGRSDESPSGGHVRRKSDSSIDYVETEAGHITPRTSSPTKLNQGARFIGLHESSPLQQLLSKRVFADKAKRYPASASSSALVPQGPSSAAGGAGLVRQNTIFFADDEEDEEAMELAARGFVSASSADLVFPASPSGMVALGVPAAGMSDIGFFVFVLTGGSWPYQSVSSNPIRLPRPLQRCVDTFAAFYDAKHKRRRLAWLHELGHGEVVARCYGGSPYTLQVSTHQIAVLVLLNKRATWALGAMGKALDLDFQELVSCLYPLIRAQLLSVTPAVKSPAELRPAHVVGVNAGFTHRSARVVVPRKCEEAELPPAPGSPRNMDPARISPSLLNERKGAVEARIVHVMKKAGSMRHDKLIEAVLEHTRKMNFVPPVDFICEVIRSDIEKDFIELMEDGPNPLYRYQA